MQSATLTYPPEVLIVVMKNHELCWDLGCPFKPVWSQFQYKILHRLVDFGHLLTFWKTFVSFRPPIAISHLRHWTDQTPNSASPAAYMIGSCHTQTVAPNQINRYLRLSHANKYQTENTILGCYCTDVILFTCWSCESGFYSHGVRESYPDLVVSFASILLAFSFIETSP